MRLPVLVAVLSLGVALTPVIPALAIAGGRPDVLILVAAAADGQDQIGVTYAGRVSTAQAHRDLAALRAATGWTLCHVRVTNAPPPIADDHADMTGSECIVPHVVRPGTHGLAVLPFVQAFRPYAHVILTYFVGAGFDFQGLHEYADKNVEISLDQHGGAYTYQIFIHNPHFGRLNLPYLQPMTPATGGRVETINCTRRRNRLCQEHL